MKLNVKMNWTFGIAQALSSREYKEDRKMMNFNEYQDLTARTAGSFNTYREELINWALGISGEAGEVADHVKKYAFHGHELDRAHIVKELGDIMWYVARIAAACGVDLNSVAAVNIVKLNKRYPEGFDTERSINRKDDEV